MAPRGRTTQVAQPALALAMATGLAACVGDYPATPQQVGESKPDVTYTYRGDQELIETMRRAEDYCRQYNAWPRNAGITNNADGLSKNVLYKCDRPITVAATTTVVTPGTVVAPGTIVAPATAVVVPPRPTQPTVTYTYRTDQELVDVTSTAAGYCMQFNARPRTVHVTPNVDGSRTVVFDCLRV